MKKTQKRYDLVVIGAGPAGTPIAIEYAKLNSEKSIALIDALGELGGECLFQGCIPSKIMEASAKHIKDLESLKAFGIILNDNNYQLVWEKIKQRKDAILSRRTDAAKELASSVGNIDIIKGFGSFESENQINIALEDGTSESVVFNKAIIATGSKSIVPNYKGNATEAIQTNDQFFHEMVLPKSLSIIGGGAIAIEFAQILATLGTQITLFVRGDKILKNIDDEASASLLETLQNDTNINVLLNAAITEINYKDDDLEITYLQEGTSKTLISQKILSAAGRKPNIDKLALENAHIDFNIKGITTTPALQTSNKNIFANGDVVEHFPKFAHTAQYTAHIVAQNLFLEHNFFTPDFDKNSWVLFSMPNFAAAGLSQSEAEERGIEILVDKFEFATEAKSQIEEEDLGYLKFIVEKKSKKIIGISIFHDEANTMGGEAALIIARGMTLKELIDTIHPHPTISEAYVMLAKKMMGDIMLDTLQKPLVKALLKIERFF